MVKIAVLPGDGIGPDVTAQAVKVLKRIAQASSVEMQFKEGLIGGVAIDHAGSPLPKETLDLCLSSDAVLLGAVGGPKWEHLDNTKNPERGLLDIRYGLNLYGNLRPAKIFNCLIDASPLKREIVQNADIMVVRELTGGLYFGEPRGIEEISGSLKGFNTMVYNSREIERIARLAFNVAMKRGKKLTSVDKANVLAVSQLWRQVVTAVSKDYPEVQLNHLYVDNCAMQLIRDPGQFDVIVTENTFGDILSDESAMITGSIGMLPSASIGGKIGLYEPIHGSAPDIAGKDLANPIASILSAAMLLRYSLDMPGEADKIEKAVEAVLEKGYRTKDIYQPGKTLVGTKETGDLIAREIYQL